MDEFNDIFQYILCCGSTVTANSKNNSDWDFNTSYVAVQLLYFSYIKIISEDFNTSYVAVQHKQLNHALSVNKNFNTSYVAVQRFFAP